MDKAILEGFKGFRVEGFQEFEGLGLKGFRVEGFKSFRVWGLGVWGLGSLEGSP